MGAAPGRRPRSWRRSRPRSRTGWTSSTSRAAHRSPTPHGRAHPCRRQRLPRRSRAGHLRRERPGLLRARHRRLAGDRARGDQRRGDDELARLRQLARGRVTRTGLGRIPYVPTFGIPPGWISTNQRLVDVGTVAGSNGSRLLCEAVAQGSCRDRSRSSPEAAASTRPRPLGPARPGRGAFIVENRPGDPTFAVFSSVDGGVISDLDGARLGAVMAGSGGAVTVRFSREILEVGRPGAASLELLRRRPDALRSRAEARRHRARLADHLVDAARVRGRRVRVRRRDEPLGAARGGAAALLLQRHPRGTRSR